jgi:nucleoside-diphosphate-sugar epimerase
MSVHLVTGATGFIGSALALELLADPATELVCTARAKRSGESAAERVLRKLRHAAEIYDRADVVTGIEERVAVVELDLAARAAPALPRLDTVWHVAASLKFEEHDREEIEASNVEGTRRLLDATRAAGASTFNYVSTAYVAGRRTGRLPEALVEDDDVVNNAYERSKVRAERLVAAERAMHTRILRPSVVVGDRATRAALSHAGLYGFIRGLLKLRADVREQMGDLLGVRPLRLYADRDATLNLVPIDVVVKAAIGISRSDSPERVFHLVNAEPPRIGDIGDAIFPLVGLKPPRVVTSPAEFTSIDQTFHDDRRTKFFRDYIFSESRVFDVAHVTEALGPDALRAPLAQEDLRAYTSWYVARLADRMGVAPA